MHQHGNKDEEAEIAVELGRRRDRHTVEERVDKQAADSRIRRTARDEFVGVDLFAKVKVRCDRVFDKLGQKIAGHDQKHRNV